MRLLKFQPLLTDTSVRQILVNRSELKELQEESLRRFQSRHRLHGRLKVEKLLALRCLMASVRFRKLSWCGV